MTEGKFKVALVQSAIPHYRLPVVRALAAHPEVDLVVLTTPGGEWTTASQVKPIEQIPNVRVMPVRLMKAPGVTLIVYRGFRELVRRERVDVIIAEPRMGLMSVVRFAAQPVRVDRKKVKLVWWFPGWRNTARSPIVVKLSDAASAVVVGRAAAAACYGSRAASRVQKLGVPANRVFIAQNAIETADLASAVTRRRAAGVDGPGLHDGLRLLFVGQILQRKHLDMVLRAMVSGGPHSRRARLRVVGAGPDRERLIALGLELGLSDRVEWMEATTDPGRLAEHLTWGEIGVLPHAGGLMLNTCMAAGLPVLCGEADGTEVDMVVDGKTGWLFTGVEWTTMSAVIEQAGERRAELPTMGQAGAEHLARTSTVDRAVRNLVNACRVAIGRRAVP